MSDNRLDKLERAIEDLAGSCDECKPGDRWVFVASADDPFEIPPACRSCGASDIVLVVTGLPRLPGDSLPEEADGEASTPGAA